MPIVRGNSAVFQKLGASVWDVVIAGSGISSATSLWRLLTTTGKSLRILVIEKGDLDHPYAKVGDRVAHRLNTYLRTKSGCQKIDPWWDADAVGGGFNVWYGQLGRFNSASFSKASLTVCPGSAELADWPISHQALLPYYELIEKALLPYGAADTALPQTGNTVSQSNLTVRPRLSDFETTVAANLSSSGHLCYVVPTCLGGRLWDTHPIDPITAEAVQGSAAENLKKGFRQYLLDAAEANANVTLLTGGVVEAVEQNLNEVQLNVRSVVDAESARVSLQGKNLFLGCGAMETVRILFASEALTRNLPIGRFFNTSTELIGYIVTRIPRAKTRDPLARFGHLAVTLKQPATNAMGKVAIYDAAMVDGFDKYLSYHGEFSTEPPVPQDQFDQYFVLKLSFKGESVNWAGKRISKQRRNKGTVPDLIVDYQDHPDDIKLIEYARATFRSIAEACPGGQLLFCFRPTKGFGLSAHLHGGAIMGHNAKASVTDPQCRIWGSKNIFVVDSASFPTSGDLNGSLTMMANAARVTDCAILGETLA